MAVPTLHIRNVSDGVYEALTRQAREAGRSLNAEVLAILEREIEQRAKAANLAQRMAELAARINLPPDAPRPEDLLREFREDRTDRLLGS